MLLQCARFDLLRWVTGHTRYFRTESDPGVAGFLHERAALLLEPPPELASLNYSIVTTFGYCGKAGASMLPFRYCSGSSGCPFSPFFPSPFSGAS